MKKYILVLLFIGIFIIPGFTFAQVGDIDPNPQASSCISIINNLSYRDRDVNKNGEVSTLQDFLQSQGYLNSEPTGYLGLLTVKAVKNFQKSSGISSSGYVGSITRAKIKTLTCDGIIPGVKDIIKPINVTSVEKLTVLSPNGGETFTNGSTQKITWQDINKSMSMIPTYYDINLVHYYAPCTSRFCSKMPYLAPLVVAQKVSGYSYSWPIAGVISTGASYMIIPDGQYTIQVCVASTEVCDSSDTYFSIVSSSNNISPTTTNDKFATCLKDKGAVLYGTFWCPHCQNQEKLFGTSSSLLNHVECSTPDGLGQTQTCKDKNILGYPTWLFADGTSLSGEQSFSKLAEKTSCVLPN